MTESTTPTRTRSSTRSTDEPITVLHVDDDPSFGELCADFLERTDDRLTVRSTTSPREAIDVLAAETVDCIVSDYEMPEMDGLEFLETVRAEYPELPFILFTGKGSEEIASEAISAGVTDYLQKQSGSERYELLANRIENAVEQHRSRQSAERSRRELRLFRRAVEASGHSIYFTDKNSVIEYVNPAFEETTGYTAEEAIGRTPAILQSGEHDDAFYEELWETILDGDIWRSEVVNTTKDGKRYTADQTIAPISDDDGEITHFVAVNADVTEHEDRERELQRYETILEALGDPVYALDADGRYTFVNEAFVELTGYAESELLGEHTSVVLDEAAIETGIELTRELLRSDGEETRTCEATVTTADGEHISCENHIALLPPAEDETFRGTAGVLRDVTEREERKRELERRNERLEGEIERRKDAEKRYRSLFENNPIVIWEEDLSAAKRYVDALAEEVDDLQAHLADNPGELARIMERVEVINVNENAVDYYGADSKAEVINNLDQVMGEEAWEILVDLWDSVAAGETQFRAETVARTFDGERRHQILKLYVPDAYADDYSRAYITGTDITERKERERELQRQNGRLEEFATVVSHDLRNPLNVAQGRLGLVDDECESEHLAVVDRNLSRMETLIEDLLGLARAGKPARELETVDLAAVAERCWRNVATEGATLEVDADGSIRADPTQFQQLLENLYRNAVEHSSTNHSDVTVRVGLLEDERGFYVEDDGPGIPKEDRDRVFESGYSTAEDGTGFGLRIVEGVADAHGWEVTATESEAGGARFEITGVDVTPR